MLDEEIYLDNERLEFNVYCLLYLEQLNVEKSERKILTCTENAVSKLRRVDAHPSNKKSRRTHHANKSGHTHA